jgi:predicted amidohydrolase YtcJ
MTGLREAHAHIAAHGREMSQLNLSECRSKRECLERLAAESARLEAAGEPGWVVANGVRVESWEEAVWPTMAELDAASPRRACMVQSFDHHACAVNSAALAAAGWHRGSADPVGGRIVRDRDGSPTGVLLESAYGAARRAVPEPTPEQWRRFVASALRDLAGHGFSEVHDLLSPVWLGPMLRSVLDELRAEIGITMTAWLYPILEDAAAVHSRKGQWESDRVVLAGAKVFADGTLNSRTAWMLEPYADGMPGLERGQAMVSPAQLDAALNLTADLGIGLAVHAIGDAAVRAVLDASGRHTRLTGVRNSAGVREVVVAGRCAVPRLRIEHAELVDEADVPRFAELGVVCSVQPCHLLYDIEALRRGQPQRLDRVLPLRELIDAGCTPGGVLWFGSDVPIVRPHPGDSIRAAVHRRREGMAPQETIAPAQAITDAEAWRSFGRRT